MKKRWIPVILVTALLVLASVPLHAYAGKVHTMEGKISAVEPTYNTVVVEVPVGKDRLFTVGGPLVADAEVKKHGRSANLEDLSNGDSVVVTWRSTPNGHVIEKLIAVPR